MRFVKIGTEMFEELKSLQKDYKVAIGEDMPSESELESLRRLSMVIYIFMAVFVMNRWWHVVQYVLHTQLLIMISLVFLKTFILSQNTVIKELHESW